MDGYKRRHSHHVRETVVDGREIVSLLRRTSYRSGQMLRYGKGLVNSRRQCTGDNIQRPWDRVKNPPLYIS